MAPNGPCLAVSLVDCRTFLLLALALLLVPSAVGLEQTYPASVSVVDVVDGGVGSCVGWVNVSNNGNTGFDYTVGWWVNESVYSDMTRRVYGGESVLLYLPFECLDDGLFNVVVFYDVLNVSASKGFTVGGDDFGGVVLVGEKSGFGLEDVGVELVLFAGFSLAIILCFIVGRAGRPRGRGRRRRGGRRG